METDRFDDLMRRCAALANKLQGHCGLPGADKDDLLQEMALALLALDDSHTDSYCLTRAYWHACKWLRRYYHLEARVQVLPVRYLVELIDSGRCRRVWC